MQLSRTLDILAPHLIYLEKFPELFIKRFWATKKVDRGLIRSTSRYSVKETVGWLDGLDKNSLYLRFSALVSYLRRGRWAVLKFRNRKYVLFMLLSVFFSSS
jgi:hypothetical protein